MNQSIKLRGRYYELPIINQPVSSITYEYSITLGIGGFYIRINNDFIWAQYSYQTDLNISSREAWKKLYDIFGKIVIDATADKSGSLHLKFENGIEINVDCREDINCHSECWHFGDINGLIIYSRPGETVILG